MTHIIALITQGVYIKKNVEMYDVGSGEKSLVKLERAYLVNWASKGELIVLYRNGDDPAMGRVDAESLDVEETVLPFEAGAAYPLADGGRLLLASFGMEQTPWTEVEELKDTLRQLRERMLSGEMTEKEYEERKNRLLDDMGL